MIMKLTLDHLVGIQQQSNLEEAEEPRREPVERTVTVWYLTVGVGLSETGTKVFVGTELNEQPAAKTVREIMMMLTYQEIIKEKKLPLSRQTSVLDLFKSSSCSRTSSPVLFRHSRWMIHVTGLQFMVQCLLLVLRSHACHFTFSTFFHKYEYISFLDESILSGTIILVTLRLRG
jgi:hypothetical protein